jgi:hypothetical protein
VAAERRLLFLETIPAEEEKEEAEKKEYTRSR